MAKFSSLPQNIQDQIIIEAIILCTDDIFKPFPPLPAIEELKNTCIRHCNFPIATRVARVNGKIADLIFYSLVEWQKEAIQLYPQIGYARNMVWEGRDLVDKLLREDASADEKKEVEEAKRIHKLFCDAKHIVAQSRKWHFDCVDFIVRSLEPEETDEEAY